MPFPISYPLVNGHRFSFASIEAAFGVIKQVIGLKSVNYSPELEPGDVYGTAPQKIGRTRGKANSTGDAEMLRLEFENLRQTLGVAGVGYGETSFDIIVQYSEFIVAPNGGGQLTVSDTLKSCRITKADLSNTDGSDASSVKLTLNIMQIWLGGQNQSIAQPGVVAI